MKQYFYSDWTPFRSRTRTLWQGFCFSANTRTRRRQEQLRQERKRSFLWKVKSRCVWSAHKKKVHFIWDFQGNPRNSMKNWEFKLAAFRTFPRQILTSLSLLKFLISAYVGKVNMDDTEHILQDKVNNWWNFYSIFLPKNKPAWPLRCVKICRCRT